MRPAKRFALTAIALLLVAALSRVPAFRGGVDLSVHDTYFVLSPDRLFFVMAVFCGLFAAAYAAFPMNPRAASWHLWVTVIGIAGFCVSYYIWAHLIAERIGSQSISARLETTTAVAFVLSFVILLFSPAIFAVNFTFAMGKLRRPRTMS
jgi:uncharacterized membrane protein